MRDPSVNRLQHFQLEDRGGAIERIRQEFISYPYTLRRNGRFVVFNVGEAKAAALKAGGCELEFTYTPAPRLLSHSSIVNLPEDYGEELVVAVALKRLIARSDTYEALP